MALININKTKSKQPKFPVEYINIYALYVCMSIYI